MTLAEFYRQQEAEEIALAEKYERVPEDQQKAAGAREARRVAEYYRRLAEQAELEGKR